MWTEDIYRLEDSSVLCREELHRCNNHLIGGFSEFLPLNSSQWLFRSEQSCGWKDGIIPIEDYQLFVDVDCCHFLDLCLLSGLKSSEVLLSREQQRLLLLLSRLRLILNVHGALWLCHVEGSRGVIDAQHI